MRVGKFRYTLQWTGIIFDPEGHLAIEREYRKHDISFKSSAEILPASMVVLTDSGVDIVLIAFSNGHIEEVLLA
jgi:hypothetical protein